MIRTLRGGVKRYVHVHAKTIQANLANGTRNPMCMVRPANNPNKTIVCNSVTIHGTSQLVPMFDRPLPGTDGRAICYLVTDAPLTIEVDA